jgi:hypothetical protein
VATRAAAQKVDAHAEPLTSHSATVTPGARIVPLSFDQQKQSWLESLQFSDRSTLKEIAYGKGRIFWTAYPVELAQGEQPAADLYAYVAGRLGITPMFDVPPTLSPGVLIYPTVLQDSVLYVMTSDSADDAKIDLRDKLTGARLTLQLPAQHAALAVIGKQEKRIVAKYGF